MLFQTELLSVLKILSVAYEDIKLQVSKCTIMYFMSDTAPITLHTDTSDYGVGGYLF